ncbi:MAG: hypothetical protein KDK01_01825 [Rhodobacteraceae bacterium]|nr:hypothetical protein [Paracoccaceae bacterium]
MKKALGLSTICISAVLSVSAALAQAIPSGCFVREYSRAHMAQQPRQVTDLVALWIAPGGAAFAILARMANQGHARNSGLAGLGMREEGFCPTARRCVVYCDGGGFDITRVASDSITISTRHLRVTGGESCSGSARVSNLAEVSGQPTLYRLDRRPNAVCGALQ